MECCGEEPRLTTGREVYPHRPDLHHKAFYVCDVCNARVGCHPGTTKALGTPANAALRVARSHVHTVLDELWRTAYRHYDSPNSKARSRIKQTARLRVYAYLRDCMNLSAADCHVGRFDMDQCRQAYRILKRVTYDDIRKIYKAETEPEKVM